MALGLGLSDVPLEQAGVSVGVAPGTLPPSQSVLSVVPDVGMDCCGC